MPHSEPSTDSPPRLWPSLLIAGILATVLPVMWLYCDDPICLRLLLAPIYVPLAFGIFWPAIVAFQKVRSQVGQPWLRRHTIATILFAVCVPCWVPFVKLEIGIAKDKRAGELRWRQEDEQREKQRTDARRAAEDAFAAHGLLGFAEPLRPAEAVILANYVFSHPDLSRDDLLRMSEHYQDPLVMSELARHKSCPPQALSLLFVNASKQWNTVPHYNLNLALPVKDVLLHVAANESTPPETLGALLRIDNDVVRVTAAKNPHTPSDVLDRLLHADVDAETRNAVQHNLDTRGAAKQ